MNIKIKIEESNSNNVRATIFEADTSSNIGTLWMTSKEFTEFTEMLTYGVSDTSSLEIEDSSTDYISDSG